ncbi:MAG: hypothetical protein M1825_005648 [Sarcosagium campestre]|nr:MAG: hypothetical protein M1825_005648 [Sarcosagium campestre]
MSATTPARVPRAAAPWRSTFLDHLSKLRSPEFVMTSLHPTASPKGNPAYEPRARYLIFRGMWAELPENKHNKAPVNDRSYESDLPTFTTDVRMEKVPELFGSSSGHGTEAQSQGSGGGGPVEAVWWVSDVMTQWRIRGEAFLIGPDIEGDGEESSGVRTVKSELGKRMRLVQGADERNWSWSRELTAHFGNLSPGMRGSFKNPPPGTPVSSEPPDKELSLGQKVDDLHDGLARKNFRVAVIRPTTVEQLDLSDPARARRWKFTLNADTIGNSDVDEIWTKEELWP